MLYAKVDESGEPIEIPKSYLACNYELAQCGVVVSREVFENNPKALGYEEVPFNGQPPAKAGCVIELGIPVRGSDGKLERIFEYPTYDTVARRVFQGKIEEEDLRKTIAALLNNQAQEMRRKRKEMLALIDRISVPFWNSLDESEKNTIRDFYKELLNITENAAWPYPQFPDVPKILNF